jgi:coenzyme F420-reducing hydrogenase gamma subunit
MMDVHGTTTELFCCYGCKMYFIGQDECLIHMRMFHALPIPKDKDRP